MSRDSAGSTPCCAMHNEPAAPRRRWWHCTRDFVALATGTILIVGAIEANLILVMLGDNRPDLIGGIVIIGAIGLTILAVAKVSDMNVMDARSPTRIANYYAKRSTRP